MKHTDIFETIVRLRREGIPAALATIVGTRGSTPGRTSMRLLVLADGTFLGTVGGGCLEAEVYDAALAAIGDEQPRSLQFRLTEQESPDSGLMCGGEVTIHRVSQDGDEGRGDCTSGITESAPAERQE